MSEQHQYDEPLGPQLNDADLRSMSNHDQQDPSFKIKLSIDIDSFYARQSRISSSVWTPLGWQQVVTIEGEDTSLPKTDIGYVPDDQQHEKYEVIGAICDRLLAATLKVVS